MIVRFLMGLFFCLYPLFVVAGDLHPCRDAQGRLFVTDRPDRLPEGCILLGPPVGGGSLSIVTMPGLESPASRGAMTAPSRTTQSRVLQQNRWRQRAEELLHSWKVAVSAIYRARRSAGRRMARQQLELLREKKKELLAEVQQQANRSFRRWMAERLAPIE